ncbi:hypothetical protein MCUN1_001831 [Malassezia cuniculi]|uniref:TPR-like protein n=1 Tax=Malassezia cuniculi TaxID=948313 RepID=A0AAF0ETL4_9BASI|nr:hypothetical protein MCUN1_001831 [Malassezia cuniculi]
MSAAASHTSAEWQLVRGAPIPGTQLPKVYAQTVDGEFSTVLRSPAAQPILAPFATALSAGSEPNWAAANVAVPKDKVDDALCVAVSALHAFIQLNWTGPNVDMNAVSLLRHAAPQEFPLRSADDGDVDATLEQTVHNASIEYLTLRGEPAYHLCTAPFLLVVALRTFDAIPNSLESLPWWRLRVQSVHRRILDEPVLISDALMNAHEALEKKLVERGANWRSLAARASLERALALQRTGFDRDASELMVTAARASGLVYELTGAPGKRTRYQKEDKMQLVLLAESLEAAADSTDDKGESRATHESESGWQPTIDPEKQTAHQPATYSLNDDTLLEQTAFTATSGAGTHTQLQHLDPGQQPPLAVTDQCILLALCLNIHNTQPLHGLTAAEMTAFVERVAAHPLNWSVHTMALLLRARLESTRTRTVERSTLQLQALIDQMPSSDSSVRERLRFFHSLELPARWSMQAELAQRFTSLGVLRSALEIYEKIELWEDVVHCLGLLGRQTEGIEIVADLLEGRKVEADVKVQQRRLQANHNPGVRLAAARAAKLWCLRGDLEPTQAERLYSRAWEVSGATSSRAARSLGGYYFARQDYSKAAEWLQRAVRINALYSRSWFMLGCAFMRLEQWVEGAAAFRKCTVIEDSDGESWNNLASCYLHMHDGEVARIDHVLDTVAEEDEDAVGDDASSDASSDAGSAMSVSTLAASDATVGAATLDSGIEVESAPRVSRTPFSHLELAYRALGVALKYNHESWKMWSNYMHVSIDIGYFAEAARALQRTVEIRARELQRSTSANENTSIVDIAVLSRLVDAVVRSPANDDTVSPNDGIGLYPTVRRLFDDTLLQLRSTDAQVLQAYAKLLFWRGEYRLMLDTRIKSFRFGVGSANNDAITTDKEAWLHAVAELRDLTDLLSNLGSREEADGMVMPDWRFQARTLVRGLMSRTRDSFEDEPEWDELVTLLDELRS